MTKAQEKHLKFIISEFKRLVDPKYRTGQKEHGGDLWKKKGIIDFAIEEAVDQVVYLLTIKQQFENLKRRLRRLGLKNIDLGSIKEKSK